ncbi:MAG: hypothetical protein M1825_002190 [Sarcosagium campestre]|nr:MAG: hypothetical protein M1825_002190 [Sarcosagium campestre]
MAQYTIRPHSKGANPGMQDAFRAYLSPTALLSQRLSSGDSCLLLKADSLVGMAIVWPATEKIQDTVLQTSRTLQATFGLKLGDKVSLKKNERPLPMLDVISVQAIHNNATRSEDQVAFTGDDKDDERWAWLLEEQLDTMNFVAVGMVFEDWTYRRRKRSFRIVRNDDAINTPAHSLYSVNPESKFQILPKDARERADVLDATLQLSKSSISGLDSQLDVLNRAFEAFERSTIRRSWLSRPGGILLYGATGTGKSLLLQLVASTGWGKVFSIDCSSRAKMISEPNFVKRIFSEAKSHARSIIILDHIDKIASKHSARDDGVHLASELCIEFQNINQTAEDPRIVVLAATNCINDVDRSLLRSPRFENEIEIPIPDRKARLDILKSITGVPQAASDELLEDVAERTHGYVGADLCALLHKAGWYGEHRDAAEHRDETEDQVTIAGHGLVQVDVDRALQNMRPTAMREIFLEVPKVKWEEIGGQGDVKRALREAVEWPLKNPIRMKRLGIEPKRGLLLFGPPGCSKTMAAKALATESGLNFLAVKGAELLNMYVGESERALRDVFSKARAASPSIIFFDEIDAIAASRSGHGSGLNVLTTLLNEMDGIETLKGVTVLAATNKPQVLDLALLRPGRLDTLLYVGPPDQKAREDILRIKFGHMDVEAEIDLADVAANMDGFTGAEITNICDVAAYMAFGECEMSGVEEKIKKFHLMSALSKAKRQVSPELKKFYESWTVGSATRI